MGSMLDLLKPDGYIMVNKKLVRTIGLNESLILGSLCSKQDYWNNHWDFQKYGQFDGFFFCTAEQFECETTLSPYQQRNAITKLEAAGLIETDLRGNPAKKYFRVNEYELELLFFDEEHLAKLKSKMSKNLTLTILDILILQIVRLKVTLLTGRENLRARERVRLRISIQNVYMKILYLS